MLEGKVVLVTGSGSGIGRATAQILANAGAKVVVADWNFDGANETVDLVRSNGGEAVACILDVSSEDDVKRMVDFTVSTFGRISGAFNNAGLSMQNKLTEDLEAEDWNRIFDVNVTGLFFCMKHEIRAMRKTGGGSIVNTASGVAVTGAPYAAEYVASKHAVLGATRAAACEAAITKVRVNAVLPGTIRTPMVEKLLQNPDFNDVFRTTIERHSIGRIGEPEEIGYAVKFLLSDEASFVNGAGLAVDGGFTSR